jgi:hypothetical protein
MIDPAISADVLCIHQGGRSLTSRTERCGESSFVLNEPGRLWIEFHPEVFRRKHIFRALKGFWAVVVIVHGG